MNDFRAGAWLKLVCAAQGAFYALTGAWPLVHIQSFKWLTGEKTDNMPTGLDADHWLVLTVALLLLTVGVVLLMASARRLQRPEIVLLAMGVATSLMVIDVVYVMRGVILPIYLVDAAVELALIVGWGVGIIRSRRSSKERAQESSSVD